MIAIHVRGFRDPDDQYIKMKEVWDACVAANVEIPEEVLDYFDHCQPGMGTNITEETLRSAGAVKNYHDVDNKHNGFEIHIDNIPKEVKIIRVYNAY